MTVLVCHNEIMKCKCGTTLNEVPAENFLRSRFRFPITHKRNGEAIKYLAEQGPFLAVAELGWCTTCEDYFLVIDSEDDVEVWKRLPNLHQNSIQ